MATLQRWSPLSAAWNRALAISLAVTILYSAVVKPCPNNLPTTRSRTVS